jgi:hypothetical protein
LACGLTGILITTTSGKSEGKLAAFSTNIFTWHGEV